MFRVSKLLRANSLVLNKIGNLKYIREYSSLSSGNSKDNKCNTTYQPIGEFYSGRSVFMTGGTGFLGKAFLEKLLYSCNKLDKVYVFVREKKGEDVNKRIENLFANPLFSRLKKTNPDFMKKVEPVTGDLRLPNLGLNPKDEQTLIDKVSVVYHAAATVKFNEPLKVAMNINFEGTQKILELSRRMKNIEAFVYISTAFTHTQRKVLLETVYPPPAKAEDIYKFIEEYGHDTEESLKFISDRPNTYTYTKALSESYIANNHGKVPAVIIRPSVVTAAKDEPLVGWLDNWFSGTPLFVNSANGWNRISHGSGSQSIDLIPVDYVANMSIIAGATAKRSSDIQVLHCTTSADNPVSWNDVHKYFKQELTSQGKNELPFPSVWFVKSMAIVNIFTFVFQKTPAHIIDLWLRMIGREPKYAKLISGVVEVRKTSDFFTYNTWVIRADRARELYSSLSPEDRKTFPCDPTQIEWSEYFRNYCKGVYKYLKPRNKIKTC